MRSIETHAIRADKVGLRSGHLLRLSLGAAMGGPYTVATVQEKSRLGLAAQGGRDHLT